MTTTVDPKFPNSIVAAIVVDETSLATYLPNRVIPLVVDRNGCVLIRVNGTVVASLGAAVTINDAIAFASGSVIGSALLGFNGAAFERIRSQANNSDSITPTALGNLSVASYFYVFDDTSGTWSRAHALVDSSDALSTGSNGLVGTIARLQGYNSTAGVYDRLVVAGDDADAIAVATLGDLLTLARNTGFNGTTWDRLRTLVSNADAQTAAVTGLQGVVARLAGYNGTTFDRLASAGDNADAVAVATLGELLTLARNTGFNGTTWDRLRTLVSNADAQTAAVTGLLGTVARLTGFNGTTFDRLLSAGDNADAVAVDATGHLQTLGHSLTYNNATWDRQRGNTAETVLASDARTITTASADLTNYNQRGVHVAVNVTVAGTSTLTVTLQGKDPVSGAYYDILIGTAIAAATGLVILKLYPGIGTLAGAAASDILPRTWRVNCAKGDASSWTYSVGANLVM